MIENKIPPQAVDLEQAIIGAALIEAGTFEEIYTILDHPKYFYKDDHRKIFESMVCLFKEGKKITAFTVMDCMDKKDLADMGGQLYIAQLTKQSTSINLQEHCLIIKQQAARREMIQLGHALLKQGNDDTVDIDDILTFAGNSFDQVNESFRSSSLLRDFSHYLNESRDQLLKRMDLAQKGKIAGIRTPVTKLTNILNGWSPGELIIIAGRPSMGKTALALASILTAAENGISVNMFSLEMPGIRLSDRLICGSSGISHNSYKAGTLTEKEFETIEKTIGKLERMNIYIDDFPLPTIDYIRSRARINKRKGKCEMVVIDYLQLLDSEYIRGQSREREVANLSRKMKALAMELGIPVLLLSQLNRLSENRADKRPQLSDLRESGAIEQDADVVLLLHRPEYYGIFEEDSQDTHGRGEICISKNRDGETGTLYFGHNESLTRIHDYEINPEENVTAKTF